MKSFLSCVSEVFTCSSLNRYQLGGLLRVWRGLAASAVGTTLQYIVLVWHVSRPCLCELSVFFRLCRVVFFFDASGSCVGLHPIFVWSMLFVVRIWLSELSTALL